MKLSGKYAVLSSLEIPHHGDLDTCGHKEHITFTDLVEYICAAIARCSRYVTCKVANFTIKDAMSTFLRRYIIF